MNIKHSKIKNTGILFEILVRKMTSELLMNENHSFLLNLLKKYYFNTELGKEYILYNTLLESKGIKEPKANIVINSLLNYVNNINKNKIDTLKYNLIKELKEKYDLKDIFSISLPNYKVQAALYVLLESYYNKNNNIKQIISNKNVLIEYMIDNNKHEGDKKDDIINEFKSCDKDVRVLAHKILIKKFNNKYSSLNEEQKLILKEIINSNTYSSNNFCEYNKKIKEIKEVLNAHIPLITNPIVKIKIQEINKNILEIYKPIKDSDLVLLLQYYDMVEELKKIHKK
jgi:hypothetical protein